MKTKTWILIFLLIVLLCVLALLFLHRSPAAVASVYSEGKLVYRLDLSQNGEYRVESSNGWNTLLVQNGTVCVTASSCAGQDCVRLGASDGGAPIVCLPNRLVVRFSGKTEYDAFLS